MEKAPVRFHLYREGTVMYDDRVNGAYRLTTHRITFFAGPQDRGSEQFYFQFMGPGRSANHYALCQGAQGPQLTVVQAAPNSSLPPDSFPDPETSADAAPVNAAATGGVPLTGFTGQQHLCFQWGPYYYAWGLAPAPPEDASQLTTARKLKQLLRIQGKPKPWLLHCVELRTGRCVATAVPLRSFRKMGTMLINAPRMQHVCMATGFKALEQAHRGFLR